MGILEMGRGILDVARYQLLSLDPEFIDSDTVQTVSSADGSIRVRIVVTIERQGEGHVQLHTADSSYPINCRPSDLLIVEEQGLPTRAIPARRLNNQTLF